jgi:hypothetical protein
MIIQSPINPTSHPKLFREEEIAGYKYFVPIYIGIGLQEELTDAYVEDYRRTCPSELVEGKVDESKYNDWVTTKEGKRITDRTAARILFIPADANTPTADTPEVYHFMGQDQFGRVFNFFKNPLPNSSAAPPSSSESGAPNPVTETAFKPQ